MTSKNPLLVEGRELMSCIWQNLVLYRTRITYGVDIVFEQSDGKLMAYWMYSVHVLSQMSFLKCCSGLTKSNLRCRR